MGRKEFEVTDELKETVKKMSAVGTRQDDIATYLGISTPTLRKHFELELKTAAIKANVSVAGKLYEQCMGGNTTAIIFWLKTRAKWRETDEDKDDKDPPPLAINFSVSPDIGDTVITRGEKRDE